MSSEVEKMAERILGAARDDWCEITQEQRNYEVHVLSDSLQAAIDERIDLCTDVRTLVEVMGLIEKLQQKVEALEHRLNCLIDCLDNTSWTPPPNERVDDDKA